MVKAEALDSLRNVMDARIASLEAQITQLKSEAAAQAGRIDQLIPLAEDGLGAMFGILDAPLDRIDVAHIGAVARMASALGESNMASRWLSKARAATSAATVARGVRQYVATKLYSPADEEHWQQQIGGLSTDQLSQPQREQLDAISKLNRRYFTAVNYATLILDELDADTELQGFVEIKAQPQLIAEVEQKVISSPLNQSRLELISGYPKLRGMLDDYLKAFANGKTDVCKNIYNTITNSYADTSIAQ